MRTDWTAFKDGYQIFHIFYDHLSMLKKYGENICMNASRFSERIKWQALKEVYLKPNIDAAIPLEGSYFYVGMLLRDHKGGFLKGKTMCFSSTIFVFKVEFIGIQKSVMDLLTAVE